MSDCCGTSSNAESSDKKSPRKFTCPVNNEDYISVSTKTILHHIKSPWEITLSEEQYYFCDDSNCDVVYFGLDGSVINKAELRTQVGIKEKKDDAFACYCFGVTKSQAKKDAAIKTYVTKQTKDKNCACDIRNPSGRCCLINFP